MEFIQKLFYLFLLVLFNIAPGSYALGDNSHLAFYPKTFYPEENKIIGELVITSNVGKLLARDFEGRVYSDLSINNAENIEAIDLKWPEPHQVNEEKFYYAQQEVVVPFEIIIFDKARLASFNIVAELYLCDQTCTHKQEFLSVKLDCSKIDTATRFASLLKVYYWHF